MNARIDELPARFALACHRLEPPSILFQRLQFPSDTKGCRIYASGGFQVRELAENQDMKVAD